MKNKCLISFSDKENYVKVFIKKNIYYTNLVHNNNLIYMVVDVSDINVIKGEILSLKIIKYYGTIGLKAFIKKHYILMLSFIFSLLITYTLSNIIFDIEVITNNSKLKGKILDLLKENNIEKYKFAPSNEKITNVKNKILKENKDTLEWIEITRSGTKYTVNITERIINQCEKDEVPSDIIAKKDALITYLVIKKGTGIKEVNELVKKGEVIVTGNIIKNEDVVGVTKADASVYGEVWYTVNISVPYKHTVYKRTGEVINHIYLDFFGKKLTLIGHYITNNSINETKVLINKSYLPFKVMKETKELFSYEKVNLTKKEAYNEALKRADQSIMAKLDTTEHIIERKVLKKEAYSSKIEIELFYRVYENIKEEREITLESE